MSRTIKSAMVRTFKAHYATHKHVEMITKNFSKSIERRRGSYTSEPGFEVEVSGEELAIAIAAAAEEAGARITKVIPHPGFPFVVVASL